MERSNIIFLEDFSSCTTKNTIKMFYMFLCMVSVNHVKLIYSNSKRIFVKRY